MAHRKFLSCDLHLSNHRIDLYWFISSSARLLLAFLKKKKIKFALAQISPRCFNKCLVCDRAAENQVWEWLWCSAHICTVYYHAPSDNVARLALHHTPPQCFILFFEVLIQFCTVICNGKLVQYIIMQRKWRSPPPPSPRRVACSDLVCVLWRVQRLWMFWGMLV